MRAYIRARGPRVFGLRTGVGVGGHVTLTGVLVWLVVVGVAELLVVVVELSFRLLKVVVVVVWRLADSAVRAVRAHRQTVAGRMGGAS